jgi:hypothetical protein
VIRIVAKAIDGAAPNRPAKLFGRNTSPSTANTETPTPPAVAVITMLAIDYANGWMR